jgi:hypothetical protein
LDQNLHYFQITRTETLNEHLKDNPLKNDLATRIRTWEEIKDGLDPLLVEAVDEVEMEKRRQANISVLSHFEYVEGDPCAGMRPTQKIQFSPAWGKIFNRFTPIIGYPGRPLLFYPIGPFNFASLKKTSELTLLITCKDVENVWLNNQETGVLEIIQPKDHHPTRRHKTDKLAGGNSLNTFLQPGFYPYLTFKITNIEGSPIPLARGLVYFKLHLSHGRQSNDTPI